MKENNFLILGGDERSLYLGEYLEKQKELIKADENHTSWQLQNIGARIKQPFLPIL